MKISVVINTKNEEKNIDRCLSSLAWADEIVVVDMHSSDATVSISKKYTNLVYSCDDYGYVEPARNQSIAYATGEWILILDADEVVSTNLAANIHDLILRNESISLIAIPRKNYIGNHLIINSGWGVDYQPRLFKKGKVTWKEVIHSWPEVKGEIFYLSPSEDFYIQHYNYVDIADFVNRLNRYTDIEASRFDLKTLDSDWKNLFQLVLDEFKFRYTPEEDGVYSLFLAGCMAFYRFISCCKALEKDGSKSYLTLPISTDEILSDFVYKNTESLLQSQSQKYQSEIDILQAKLQQAQSELERADSQLQQMQRYFEDAVNEIKSMETSKFWKLRKVWFKFKRLVFLSHQTLMTEGFSPLISRVERKIKKKLPSHVEKQNSIDLSISTLELPTSIKLDTSNKPLVSIVIPVFNQSNYTFNCLNSIRSIESIEYEVIVIDDTSTDNTKEVLSNIEGIKVITNSNNLGFIRSCNKGISEATGKFICFLNNDTKVFPDWMKSLLEIIENDASVGAVGSKLIYPDGRLQEAGGIIWRNASGCNFGRFDNPNKPEYNYVREVDYCSGASLLVRGDLLRDIGGFSEEFLPAYYEDTDLCFTIRSLGYRVMYQPKSQVIHFEGISSGTDINSGIKKHQLTNAIKFEIKWRETLKNHLSDREKDTEGARRYAAKPTILIIDSYVPLYDKESGSCRIYNIIKIFKKLGYSIVFLPDNGFHQEPYVSELQSMGVEVLYSTEEMPEMKSHLLARLATIDIAWVCRPELCEKYLDLLKQNSKIKLIYDTIDLHFIRLKREKELLGDSSPQKVSWQSVQQQELSLAKSVQSTIVVTEIEKNILSSFGISDVTVIPNIHEVYSGVLPDFDARKGLLFIGGYNHVPNVDAVMWLCKEIMPFVWKHYPEMQLTLLGSNPPSIVKGLQEDRVNVTGYVRDIEPYFLNHRVFVAPLRYGAGLKGKIGQSLSYGLPVVTTSIGSEGFGLIHEREAMIVEEPEDFANHILALYENLPLWQSMSSAALQSIGKYKPEIIEIKLKTLINNILNCN